MINFDLLAAEAAHYWHEHLSPRVSRPAHLEAALLTGIQALQAYGPQPVVFCSRPEAYHSPGLPGVNLLALTAHHLGLQLTDFDSALLVLYPDQGAELRIHPQGQPRPLLPEFPVSQLPLPRALPPGRIQFDPVSQTYLIPLSPNHDDLADYEIVFTQA